MPDWLSGVGWDDTLLEFLKRSGD